jgi:putative ABC transport system permease protein
LNFLKRAILAVIRRKGKAIIMFVIFAAIANMVLAGLAIQHATEYASVLARQKLGGQLTLMFDRQSAMQKARESGEERPRIQPESVTEDMIGKVAGIKHITGSNNIVNANGVADGFNPVETDSDSDTGNNQSQRQGSFGSENFVMPDISVTGVSSTTLENSFGNGDSKLVDGKHITLQDAGQKVVMVEKNLAEQNSLKVGSKIKIKATRSDEIVEFTIVGIYEASKTSSTDSQNMRGFSFTDSYNRIYSDYKSALTLKAEKTDTEIAQGGIDSAIFFVDDPQNVDTVKTEAKSLNIDWSKYTLDANDTAYKQMLGPIENVASFSMTVVYIVAIVGAIILALVLMLSIKERMYETGVLLSMGEGKLKIIGQYVAEALVIAVIAFSLSTVSGKYIAQGVGNMLLSREIKVEQQTSDSFGPGGGYGRFMGGNLSGQNYQSIDTLDIKINPSELGKMSAAGLIILLAGTILPATTIMRYKPKEILTKGA